MWKDAKPLDEYIKNGRKSGLTYCQMAKKLHCVECRMAEYGDWILFQDDEGNLWEEYRSIGD